MIYFVIKSGLFEQPL